ncbi:MAG: DUF1028 domain-containing protein [Planctomycetota bacterium]|nr:DUF1028 domain-containing protein [Planctomycetota bacterium]
MRRLIALLVPALALTLPARATWGIVLINRATMEVGVACATCIENVDLVPELPIVRPGMGVGNVQAWWDSNGSRRKTMWDAFGAGKTPQATLDELRQISGHHNYQFGIANFFGPPVSYTGTTAMDGVCNVAGESGDWAWAIQGNVITGEPVCLAAEQAILNTPGDLATKLMAAMEAARLMGGDGRCSCHPADADGCGSPPPSFTKTAHTAFLIVARVGDEEGTCTSSGCAKKSYYLKRNVVGDSSDIDPIFELANELAVWRQNQAGKPDHILSTKALDRQVLVADGASRATVTVVLRDIDDVPLGVGGASLAVAQANGGPATALVGPVTDHGDGSYSFDLTATGDPGRGAWDIVVDFGGAKARQLWPPITLETRPLTEDLFCGFYEYVGGTGLEVPFELNRPAIDAGRPYHLLGTLSGTLPGLTIGGAHVPLNRDDFFVATWLSPGPPDFPG